MTSTFRRTPLFAAAVAALCTYGGSPAQTVAKKPEIESVTITAERREASVQKTAISVATVSGDEVQELGLTNATQTLQNIVNVEIQGAARGNVIAMRGIGSDLPPGMGESSVSTAFDGVYNFRAEGMTVGFFDIDRVEVLRGPQGTLYGRSAAGGAVNFITRGPQIGKTGGYTSLELGSYSLVRAEGAMNVPVSDTLAVRIAGASIHRKGTLTDGFNDDVTSAGRLKVLFNPMKGVSLQLGHEAIRLGGKGPGFIPQDNWKSADKRLQAATGDGVEVGYQTYTQDKTWMQLDADLGIGTLTVLPSWQRAKGEVYRKKDLSRPPGSEEQWNLDPQNAQQDSLEVRFASGSRSSLTWVVGYYGYKMSSGTYCFVSCAPPFVVPNPNNASTDSKALFGQATVPLSASLRLTAGLRRTKDDKAASNPAGADLTDSWKSTDGKLGLEFDVAPSVMSYATWATSYRPGGFNGLPFSVQPLRFESEKLKSLELGVKSRFLDNRLQVNAALFQLDYENYQIVDFAPPVYSSISNVPKQKMRGLEVDSRLVFEHGGALRASLALMDAKLGSYKLVSTGADLSGNPMPHAPKTTFKAGYELPLAVAGGELLLRADLRHVSEQYVSASENPDTLQPTYTSGDLAAVYTPASGRWSLTAYVKNVGDYVVKTSNFGGYTQVGAPRTTGLILNSKF